MNLDNLGKSAARLAIAGLVLLLTACATGPGYQSAEVRSQMRTANKFYAAGEWSLAAEAFERIAVQQQQPDYSQSMLRAADARVLAQDWQQARANSNRVTESALNQSDLAWLQFVRAELALRRGDLESAQSLLLQMASLPRRLFSRLEILSSRLQLQKSAPETRARRGSGKRSMASMLMPRVKWQRRYICLI